MLAATPDRTSSLRLLQVVLRIAEDPAKVQVSDPSRAHALDVLRQAAQIAANPALISGETAREAIELALRLKELPTLSGKLAAALPAQALPPELAKELLTSLQPLAA